LSQPFGDGDAIIHGHVADRHEGTDVRRADARMRAGVLVEINQFGGGLDGAEGGLLHARGCACEGQHRAVVVEVGGTVKQFHIADRLNGGGDLVYHFGSPRFGKIGDTFDELGHGIFDFGLTRAIPSYQSGMKYQTSEVLKTSEVWYQLLI